MSAVARMAAAPAATRTLTLSVTVMAATKEGQTR